MPVTVNELKAIKATLEKIQQHAANKIKWADSKIAALQKEQTAPKAKPKPKK